MSPNKQELRPRRDWRSLYQHSSPSYQIGTTSLRILSMGEARVYSGDKDMELLWDDYGLPHPATERIISGTLARSRLALDADNDDRFQLDAGMDGYLDLYLFSECAQGNGNSPNDCSTTCSDRSSLFGSWYSLWQCLMLASLILIEAQLPEISNGALAVINDTFAEVEGFSSATFDGLQVIDSVVECAVESCQTSGGCSINLPKDDPDYPHWDRLSEELENICSGRETKINGDIAGPGVLISYTIQAIVCVVIWGSVRILTVRTTLEAFARPVRFCFGKRGKPFTDNRPRLSAALSRIEDFRFAHATITFIVEFQEAQCYFVIGVATALLIASSRMSSIVISEDWQGLLTTREVMRSIADRSIYPLLVVQLMLSRVRLNSFYTLVLTTVALAVVAAMFETSIKASPDDVWNSLRERDPIEACGGQASLRAFCLMPPSALTDTTTLLTPLILIAFLAVCWIQKFSDVVTRAEWYRTRRTALETRRPKLVKWGLATAWPFGVTIMVLVESYIVWNVFFTLRSKSLLSKTADGEWNIGQILALLIFVPAVSKFVHLVALGIEEGFKTRLSPAFLVVRRSQLQHSQGTAADYDKIPLLPTTPATQSSEAKAVIRRETL